VIYRKHREFSRGFLEIVPRSAFSDAKALQRRIEDWNPPKYFRRKDRFESWKYVLTMSREKVHMGTHMGANSVGGEQCDDGILSIYEYDWSNWPLKTWGDAVDDMEDRFIPPNIRDSDAMKRIPLITVWQLDGHYQPTGCKLVETTHEGVVVIRQPAEICDPGIGATCEIIPGWKCLQLDSYRWKEPKRKVEEQSLDCHCFE
jgi:hypothetical protein